MSILLLIAAQAAAPATTTTATDPNAADQSHSTRGHDDEAIVVTGVRRDAADVLGGVSVVAGAELARDLRPSIGETLASQPGVSASSFGPTASRPILRGLSGDRIRILQDGIGSFDVSSSSADHAVAINPLTAERIEVLRGPAALVFGSSAIGGVVNVLDTRIPRRMPETPLHADALATYGSAANERSVNLSVDVPLGSNFVLHGDGNYSKSDDLETGGYLLSKPLRRIAETSADPEIRDLADLKGKLPNTDAKTWELAGGLAYVGANGLNIGASVTHHDSLYGVPIRFSLDPAVEAEAPHIDVAQTRYDARATIPIGGAFKELRLRGATSRYRHDEIEDTGDVASTFRSNGTEIRADAEQTVRNGWGGTSGIQFIDKDVSIRGEEKFLPDSRQKQVGLYTLQTLDLDPLRLEAGARIEFSRLSARADEDLDTPDYRRKFTTVSLSGGATYAIAENWKAGLSVSRSARAPSIDELFANGPHAGTQAFEIGDPDLNAETSVGVEASLRHSGPVSLGFTLYHNRFANFIFQRATGAVEDDLPVYQYGQGKARFTGFEMEAKAPLGTIAGVEWGVEGIADAVRGTIKGFGPAPQIPPLRLQGTLTGKRGPVDGRLEVEHAFAQRRNAPLETETPAYTLVNASLEWHPMSDRPEFTLGLAANNIFDVVARRHTSLLKDYAPLAGRDIRLTASMTF